MTSQYGAHGGQPVGRVAGQLGQGVVAQLLSQEEQVEEACTIVREDFRRTVGPLIQADVRLLQVKAWINGIQSGHRLGHL